MLGERKNTLSFQEYLERMSGQIPGQYRYTVHCDSLSPVDHVIKLETLNNDVHRLKNTLQWLKPERLPILNASDKSLAEKSYVQIKFLRDLIEILKVEFCAFCYNANEDSVAQVISPFVEVV